MPKMSRKLSPKETEEIEFAKMPKMSRKMSPKETEEIEVTLKWVEELNKIGKRIEEIKATIKCVEEGIPRGTQARSESVVETDINLMNLKREYNQLVRNYNRKYQKHGGSIKLKRLERIKFGDEVGQIGSWGKLDKGMHEWVHYMFYTLYLEELVYVNWL